MIPYTGMVHFTQNSEVVYWHTQPTLNRLCKRGLFLCNRLKTCQRCTPPFAQWQLGLALTPVTLNSKAVSSINKKGVFLYKNGCIICTVFIVRCLWEDWSVSFLFWCIVVCCL